MNDGGEMLRRKLRFMIDAVFAIVILSTLVISGFDLVTYFTDGKAEHTARYCNRACHSEYDASLINVGIEGNKVICNCEVKK